MGGSGIWRAGRREVARGGSEMRGGGPEKVEEKVSKKGVDEVREGSGEGARREGGKG